MKTIQKCVFAMLLPVLFAASSILISSCSKDDQKVAPVAYTCASCHNTPEALAVNDGSNKGIYKGIVVGSTGTISINIQNGSSTITATMVLDGTTILLTSNVSVVNGEPYVAPFTGTYNGSPVSFTFSVGLSGSTPTVTSSDIPGHPNAVFQIFKETSNSLIEAFEGTYSKTGESGTFNILLSKGLGQWGGIAKKNGGTTTDNVNGTYNASNQIIADNGTVVATVNGDILAGSFTDSNGSVITVNGNRTL